MLKDITLGQYYPAESAVHRLDPRTKIGATLLYIVSLFLVGSFWGFGLAALAVLLVNRIATIPLRYLLRGLKPVFIIVLFTFLLNLFMTPGTILWQWRFLKITEEGLTNAAFMSARLILLVTGASIMTLSTKPIALTDGIEALLSPFKKIGLPAHELAMMMSIALRFIPTLMDEADKIMKAQMARGADFESGNIFRRAKALIPLLVPLFVSAFRIAQDLAMAMEARCYRGGEHRTRLHPMQFSRGDAIFWLCFALYAGGIVCLSMI